MTPGRRAVVAAGVALVLAVLVLWASPPTRSPFAFLSPRTLDGVFLP